MALTPVLGNFKQEGLKKQVVNNVLCFSSQYGASQSYAASNLVGDKYNYPSYGDFTQAFVLVGNISYCSLTTVQKHLARVQVTQWHLEKTEISFLHDVIVLLF